MLIGGGILGLCGFILFLMRLRRWGCIGLLGCRRRVRVRRRRRSAGVELWQGERGGEREREEWWKGRREKASVFDSSCIILIALILADRFRCVVLHFRRFAFGNEALR